jgi:hypothetical protein
MTWWRVAATLRRRIEAAEPAALKLYFEHYICRPHGTTIRYTADRTEWFAKPLKKFVSVPPPVDLVALAVDCHEAGHCVAPRCEGPGHEPDPASRSHSCVECERLAWRSACDWLPFFDRPMQDRLRSALGTYLEFTPAPAGAQREAAALMGTVSWAARVDSFKRFDEKVARQERIGEQLQRERAAETAKRDRWNQLVARQARVAASLRKDAWQ